MPDVPLRTFRREERAIRNLLNVSGFFMRHFLFVLFGMLSCLVVWTVAYAVLMIVAMVSGGGPGGPFAFPAGALFILLTGMVIGWGIFMPASGLGALLCHILSLPRLAAIPFVFSAALCLGYLTYWLFIRLLTSHPPPAVQDYLNGFTIHLAFPLGIYWWLTEGPGALFATFRSWLNRRMRRHG